MKTIKFPPKHTGLQRNFCLRKSLSIPNIHRIIAIQIDSKKQLLYVYNGKLNILNLLTNEIVFESADIKYCMWHEFRLSRDNSIIATGSRSILKFSNNFDFSPVWKNEVSEITGLTIELDMSNQKQDLIYV